MLQAFIIVMREGFEAFLIVSLIFSYLKKIGQYRLVPAVNWGVAVSLFSSTALGFVLAKGVNEPLWEGVLGLVAAVMVASLVIHMWITAPHMKQNVEKRLHDISERPKRFAFFGVFIFTVFMISREGMEAALMLIQVPRGEVWLGVFLGLAATGGLAWMWAHFSRLINLKLFFQVTSIFLLLFVGQILIYSFHEFAESGVIPNSEAFHNATEPLSPDGIYGKWFSLITVAICMSWLVIAGVLNYFRLRKAAADSR